MATSTTDATTAAPDASISTTAALAYWSSVTADDNGMLGGFPEVSRIDLQGSRTFLAKLKRNAKIPAHELLTRVVDCGAGIGRITSGFLINVAECVDVVEPVEKFTSRIEEGLRPSGRLGDVFTMGLEEWDPAAKGNVYDCIWIQWCLGQLKDEQIVACLERCKPALAVKGWIVVKENLTQSPDEADVFDETDSSVTRSDSKFRDLFQRAGLKILATELQKGFPKGLGLYPVRAYALRPADA